MKSKRIERVMHLEHLNQPPHRIYARTPWQLKDEYLPYLCDQGINAELYLSSDSIGKITGQELTTLRQTLASYSLYCTLHAPTAGFDPGSRDQSIRDATRQTLVQTLRLARLLKARSIVVHSGFLPSFGTADTESWIRHSIMFWNQLLPEINAADILITVENLYEQQPTPLRRILEGVRSRRLRHCFDCGHHNIYATATLEAWFSELGRYCAACHLHDNHGSVDQHLIPGEGTIDFVRIAGLLYRHAPAASWTLEARSLEQLQQFYSQLQLKGTRWHFSP